MFVANINKNRGKFFYEMIENLMICHSLLIKKCETNNNKRSYSLSLMRNDGKSHDSTFSYNQFKHKR